MKRMKKMNRIIAVLVAALFVCAPVASATTQRLGADLPVQFNPTKVLSKTANYTVTTSDYGAIINVNATSGNLTITLPTTATLTAVNYSFPLKIVKTDATVYTVTVTPGTGDTIGGESTRVLNSQNAYMVIHNGPGKTWTIDYESPYVTEDHEAGTVVFQGLNTFTSDVSITGTTPKLTVGDAGAEDAQITYDGNAVDFSIGLDDSADTLVINKGSTLGTTNIMSINNTPTFIMLHDASAADATVAWDGNAVDFALGLDDSGDVFTLSSGTTLGTTNIMKVASTPTTITFHDASAADATFVLDGNAVDFSFGLDDSADSFVLSKDAALGTTNIMKIANTPTSITLHDASAADATIILDGNAVDFSFGLDDSVDKLVVSKDSALGTTNIVAISNTPTTITLHDASEADLTVVMDGNAVDFGFGLDDSGDTFVLGKGSTLGTTPILTITNTPTSITVHDASAADATIVLDGNAQDFYACLDDSADDLLFGLGATCGTTPAFAIDENVVTTWTGGTIKLAEVTTGTDTLTVADCGKTIFLNSATEYATTLPAISTAPAGCEFTVIVKAAASGANYTLVTGNTHENVISGTMEVAGAVVDCRDEDTINFVDGNAVGDWVKVISDGAAWYLSGSALTAVKATCTTT